MHVSKCEEKVCRNAEKIGICRWRSEKYCSLIEEYKDFETLCQRKERPIKGNGFRKLLWERWHLCWWQIPHNSFSMEEESLGNIISLSVCSAPGGMGGEEM